MFSKCLLHIFDFAVPPGQGLGRFVTLPYRTASGTSIRPLQVTASAIHKAS